MNTSKRLKALFDLYIAQTASASEQQEFWDYIDDPLYKGEIDEILSQYFLNQTDEESLDQPQAEIILNNILTSDKHPEKVRKISKTWYRAAIAAAITGFILFLGIYITKVNRTENADNAISAAIIPGKQGATLTLANGKKIRLTDTRKGLLAHETGVNISKTETGQIQYDLSDDHTAAEANDQVLYNTLSTANGETFKVVLPDGSLVYLNAASSITYETSLAQAKARHVTLHGEGYFEVAKISRLLKNGQTSRVPFIVSTDRSQVEVLGTHFNINSYTDEVQERTTLVEGSVRVSPKTSGPGENILHTAILKPGQEAVLSSGDEITVQHTDAENAIAWKNGFFHFEDASLETVLRQFARWYDVKVIYKGKMPNRLFNGDIYRNTSFTEALKIMAFAKVKFHIEGKNIIVSP